MPAQLPASLFGRPAVLVPSGIARASGSKRQRSPCVQYRNDSGSGSGSDPSGKLDKLLNLVAKLQADTAHIKERQNKLTADVAWIIGREIEDLVRKAVENVNGPQFVSGLLACTILELVQYALSQLKGPTKPIDVLAVCHTSTLVAKQLIASRVPQELALSLLTLAQDQPVVISTTEPNAVFADALGRCIGTTTNTALKLALLRLKKFFEAESLEEQVEALLNRAGPGIMCVVAAAQPNMPTCVPMDKAAFRLRWWSSTCAGPLSNRGSEITIVVGEVKSSLDYSVAVPQLALRLDVLRYILGVILGDNNNTKVSAIGQIYVSKSLVSSSAMVDKDQQERADKDFNYFLELFVV